MGEPGYAEASVRHTGSRLPLVAAAGDLLALAAFVAVGLLFHAIDPLAFPRHAVMTALPFLIGWVVVAPFGGIYARKRLGDLRATLVRVALVWVVASTLGAAIRATPLFHGGAPLEFVLVNVVFGLAFLLPWRTAFALVVRHRGR